MNTVLPLSSIKDLMKNKYLPIQYSKSDMWPDTTGFTLIAANHTAGILFINKFSDLLKTMSGQIIPSFYVWTLL